MPPPLHSLRRRHKTLGQHRSMSTTVEARFDFLLSPCAQNSATFSRAFGAPALPCSDCSAFASQLRELEGVAAAFKHQLDQLHSKAAERSAEDARNLEMERRRLADEWASLEKAKSQTGSAPSAAVAPIPPERRSFAEWKALEELQKAGAGATVQLQEAASLSFTTRTAQLRQALEAAEGVNTQLRQQLERRQEAAGAGATGRAQKDRQEKTTVPLDDGLISSLPRVHISAAGSLPAPVVLPPKSASGTTGVGGTGVKVAQARRPTSKGPDPIAGGR